jgi:hypothetical protein
MRMHFRLSVYKPVNVFSANVKLSCHPLQIS